MWILWIIIGIVVAIYIPDKGRDFVKENIKKLYKKIQNYFSERRKGKN